MVRVLRFSVQFSIDGPIIAQAGWAGQAIRLLRFVKNSRQGVDNFPSSGQTHAGCAVRLAVIDRPHCGQRMPLAVAVWRSFPQPVN
jgi:hypothetical protein